MKNQIIAKTRRRQKLRELQTSPNPEDGVAGLIERVTFYNEETGFAVLRVKVKGRLELAMVVGSLASVSAGDPLRRVRDVRGAARSLPARRHP